MGASHFSGPVVSDNGFEGDISISTSITTLTDSSGGTSGGDTVAAIADDTTTGSADLDDVQNAIATLAAKINEIISALS